MEQQSPKSCVLHPRAALLMHPLVTDVHKTLLHHQKCVRSCHKVAVVTIYTSSSEILVAMACISTLCFCMQGTVASVQQDMQQRLEEALAENKAQAESLREARERNMHFSARVVALNSRVAQLTKQVCP